VAAETSGTCLALAAADASPYSTDRKQGFLRKSHNVNSVALNLLNMEVVRLCRVIGLVKDRVSLNERNVSFVNLMKYFDVMSERKPEWKIPIQMTSRILQKI
jgi:hypothetical protein